MTEERKEKKYLKGLIEKVNFTIANINESIYHKKSEIDEMHHHMQEHKTDMDHLEKNALRGSILNYSQQVQHHKNTLRRLFRLRDIPYFGRIDFTNANTSIKKPVYVGVHNFQHESAGENLVYDWRAPISSMFYDFEPGEAFYETNSGVMEGEISLKRQFRIRKGEMQYMLDSALTILDVILQRELSLPSAGNMKSIVATIQREQNSIIRNEDARHQ